MAAAAKRPPWYCSTLANSGTSLLSLEVGALSASFYSGSTLLSLNEYIRVPDEINYARMTLSLIS